MSSQPAEQTVDMNKVYEYYMKQVVEVFNELTAIEFNPGRPLVYHDVWRLTGQKERGFPINIGHIASGISQTPYWIPLPKHQKTASEFLKKYSMSYEEFEKLSDESRAAYFDVLDESKAKLSESRKSRYEERLMFDWTAAKARGW